MTPTTRNQLAFTAALLLVAANLRPSLTSVGPLLRTIQQHLALSATAAGLLNSLPLLMFAAAAPLARFAVRHGAERLLLLALFALCAGILLRSGGQVFALYGGTVVLASGIAVANILVPILIKQHFPDRIPRLTTAYATVMAGFAGLASGLAVPLAQWLPGGWRGSLACWAALAMLAVLFWLPHRHSPPIATATNQARGGLPLWKTALAWQVTAFMGLQAAVFYTTITWYPAVIADAGFSAKSAGGLLMLYQLIGLVSGLAVPALIRRCRDQRLLALGFSLLAAVGNLGTVVAPQAAPLWAVVMGIGSGPCLILALSFMGLRARDPRSAAALSLMAQALGYLLASVGPLAFGMAHDQAGGWTMPLVGVALAAMLQGLCGFSAGRLRAI